MAKVERGVSLQSYDSPLVSLIFSPSSTSSLPISKHLEVQSLSAHDYLLSLTSRSLVDLRSQPAALSTAKSSLNTQLSSLCSQHVSSFAQVHRATSSLPSSLNSLDSALQSLIERDLPALSNVAQQFSQQIEAPLQAKEKAQNLISQYDLMLKDLLDIPRLLMTCVRANHPVEALQLAVHMMKIVAQTPYSNLHKALQEECWAHLKRLREDLLRGLGARGLRLPAAKRLVSLLRKFKEIDEAGRKDEKDNESTTSVEKLNLTDSTICLSFLRSRWTLIEEMMGNASTTKSTSMLSLHLSTWRDVVGDTCGLAQALFTNSSGDEYDELSPDMLVFLFSHQALSTLQHILSDAIPSLREEATSLQDNFDTLATIHTQLAYSAASLARQGLEISRIVSGQEILHLEVIDLWRNALTEARVKFERCRLGKNANDCLSWIDRERVQDILGLKLQSYSTPTDWSTQAKQFPDLILFINSILQSYNALLSFTPHSTGRQVVDALDFTLLQVLTPLLSTMETNERVELNLSLPPIMSSDQRSRFFESDAARQSEANMAVLARFMMTFTSGVINHVRTLLMDLYGMEDKEDAMLSHIRKKILDWSQQAEHAWIKGEETRKERVRVEEEKLAAEERRQREEEEIRLAEMERMRVEEATRRQEEEAQRERQRLVELKKAEEAEAERRRVAEADETRMLRQQAFQDKERQEAEEKKRKQQKQQEEEAQRAKDAEEQARRVLEAEEDAIKQKKAEEEAALLKDAQEEELRHKEGEEEARKREVNEEGERQDKVSTVAEVGAQQHKETDELVQTGKEEDEEVETEAEVVKLVEEKGDAQIPEAEAEDEEIERGAEEVASTEPN